MLELLACNFAYCSFQDFWNAKLVSYLTRCIERHWHVFSLRMRHLKNVSRQATASKAERMVILVPNKQSQYLKRTDMFTFYTDRKRSMSQLNQDKETLLFMKESPSTWNEGNQSNEWGSLSLRKATHSKTFSENLEKTTCDNWWPKQVTI